MKSYDALHPNITGYADKVVPIAQTMLQVGNWTAANSLPLGSLSFTGNVPVVTGTGTPTISSGSTDSAGEIISGSTATSVIITFATVKASAPFCIVTPQTQLASFAYTTSTTAITITQTATTGEKIDYGCIQN